MNYADRALDFLEAQAAWCYLPGTAPASEPAAFAALALAAYGRAEAAARAHAQLRDAQVADGSIPVRQGDASPGWPTSLAVLAWNLPNAAPAPFAEASCRAVDWLMSIAGETSAQTEYTGHDTTIRGWPWVVGTHSWIEPTAMSVLALKTVGLANHPRAREGVRLLEDRLLPAGGCNYGNTIVLGQALLPHIEPTGAALLALAGEPDRTGKVRESLAYLAATLAADTASASLAYGLLGLAAFDRVPASADAWIAAAMARSVRRGSSLEVALLALAALKADAPLISPSVEQATL